MARPATLLFSDVPDPDNFLMHAFHALYHPTHHLAIVLSPRPVSFSIIPFDSRFKAAKAAVDGDGPPRTMLTPITSAQQAEEVRSRVPAKYRCWFGFDAGFESQGVREDTRLYMTVSTLRLVSFLKAHDVERSRYCIYADAESWSERSTIAVGLHHLAHVADFTFDFDEGEVGEYERCVKEALERRDNESGVESAWLRMQLRLLCERYTERKAAELDVKLADVLHDFDDLIEACRAEQAKPDVLVGGPFTEVAKYLEHTDGSVSSMIAMAGSIDGSRNFFKNQFNLAVDLKAAQRVFDLVEWCRIPMTVLPTECVKGSSFAFTRHDVEKFRTISAAGANLIRQYYSVDTSSYPLFDLVAAVMMAQPHLLTTKAVAFEMNDDGVLKTIPHRSGHIRMFWNDKAELKKSRDEMLATIWSTFMLSKQEG